MTATKLPKKVVAAKELYDRNQTLARTYKQIERVVRQPLPPHKERYFNVVSAQAYVKFYNAEQAFKNAYQKLSQGHKRLLADLVRGDNEAKTV